MRTSLVGLFVALTALSLSTAHARASSPLDRCRATAHTNGWVDLDCGDYLLLVQTGFAAYGSVTTRSSVASDRVSYLVEPAFAHVRHTPPKLSAPGLPESVARTVRMYDIRASKRNGWGFTNPDPDGRVLGRAVFVGMRARGVGPVGATCLASPTRFRLDVCARAFAALRRGLPVHVPASRPTIDAAGVPGPRPRLAADDRRGGGSDSHAQAPLLRPPGGLDRLQRGRHRVAHPALGAGQAPGAGVVAAVPSHRRPVASAGPPPRSATYSGIRLWIPRVGGVELRGWVLDVTRPRLRAQPLASLPKRGLLRLGPQSRWRIWAPARHMRGRGRHGGLRPIHVLRGHSRAVRGE